MHQITQHHNSEHGDLVCFVNLILRSLLLHLS